MRFGLFPKSGVSGLLAFVNTFAVPCLLFRAMLDVDFAAVFNAEMIAGYYSSALFVLVASPSLLARFGFGNRPGEAVATGFAAVFSNTVLLGLPIVQRAYGEDRRCRSCIRSSAFTAPTLMTVSLIAMEILAARRRNAEQRSPSPRSSASSPIRC